MKLFCFPYAGGAAAIYTKWKSYMQPKIEMRAIELAGRGKRIQEAHYNEFDDIIKDVFSQIVNEIKYEDYAFFGHSMGAKISFALTQEILRKGLPGPKHVFFSGRGAPYVPGKDEIEYYKLPDEEFKEKVFKLGGTPKELFEHPELMETFLPLLRNDFRLAEVEEINKEFIPLDCSISIFLGKEEDLTPEQIDSWKKYTAKSCSIYYFNGGHFFINDYAKEIVDKVMTTLQKTSSFINEF